MYRVVYFLCSPDSSPEDTCVHLALRSAGSDRGGGQRSARPRHPHVRRPAVERGGPQGQGCSAQRGLQQHQCKLAVGRPQHSTARYRVQEKQMSPKRISTLLIEQIKAKCCLANRGAIMCTHIEKTIIKYSVYLFQSLVLRLAYRGFTLLGIYFI